MFFYKKFENKELFYYAEIKFMLLNIYSEQEIALKIYFYRNVNILWQETK